MFDPSDDYLVFDGLETIKFIVKDRSNQIRTDDARVIYATSETIVDNCLRREITIRQSIDSEGKLRTGDVWFEVPKKELPNGFIPIKSMQIVPIDSPEELWEVLAVDNSTLKTRFRLHCRK